MIVLHKTVLIHALYRQRVFRRLRRDHVLVKEVVEEGLHRGQLVPIQLVIRRRLWVGMGRGIGLGHGGAPCDGIDFGDKALRQVSVPDADRPTQIR